MRYSCVAAGAVIDKRWCKFHLLKKFGMKTEAELALENQSAV
jgi:hypothetical protein